MRKTDFLVIGSGIAGLSFAIKAAKKGKVLVLTKVNADETNTKYAQGGIAAVFDPETDSYEKHINDTLIAGDGLCDRDIVEVVVKEGPDRIRELIEYGANFDKQDDGDYDLTREGGHSAKRILHYKDITGWEVERVLLEEVARNPNIEILTHYYAVELITQHHLGQEVTRERKDTTCFGIYALDIETGNVETILSKMTLMASGGAGHIYAATTNPVIATGDGIAMVYRAKGRIRDMEMMQFHPTSLYNPDEYPSFLITEAVRGEGGILRDKKGYEFMYDYDERGNLAPRDIVARSIDAEMKKAGEPHVWLDITHKPKEMILDHFPNIYERCLELGIDITKNPIPVVPAAHYTCGGVVTDMNGRTDIPGLYAIGETAHTGLHGANRLASNSLLECIVFAQAAAKDILNQPLVPTPKLPAWDESRVTDADEEVVISHNWDELRRFMWSYVGIVRTTKRLQRAQRRIELLREEIDEYYANFRVTSDLLELRNLVDTADLIVKCAKLRHESRGLHFSLDHPNISPKAIDTVPER